jgi:hypothetical protein
MGSDGTPCMHWIRSLGQNIWINHRQTIVWHRTRKLRVAHHMGTDKSATPRCTGNIRPGDSFVDDTTNGSTNDDPEIEPVSSDKAELTMSEETLIDLLQVTDGDLAPEKCVWYLISHRWKDDTPRLLQKHSSHRRIKIMSISTNTESGVKRKAPNEGHLTLGFFMKRDRTCSAHKKLMTEKSSLYATSIQRISVWKRKSGLAYNSFYLPST